MGFRFKLIREVFNEESIVYVESSVGEIDGGRGFLG